MKNFHSHFFRHHRQPLAAIAACVFGFAPIVNAAEREHPDESRPKNDGPEKSGFLPLDRSPKHGLFALTNTGNWVIEDGKRHNLFDYDVSGVTNYIGWREVEPQKGDFRFPGFDAIAADAKRTNKLFSYNILAGIHTPKWVYENGVEPFVYQDRGREVSSFLPWKEVEGKRVLNTESLKLWDDTVKAFSRHIYNSPARDRKFYVAITGFPFGNGLELMVGMDNYEDFKRLNWNKEAEDLYIEYGKKVVDIFISAFPDFPLGLAFADYYGTNKDGTTRRSYRENDEIIQYALGRAKLKGVTLVPMGLWLGWNGVMAENHPLAKQMKSYSKGSLAVAFEGQMGTWKFPNCIPLPGQIDFAKSYPVGWVQLWHHDVIHPEYQSILPGLREQMEKTGTKE